MTDPYKGQKVENRCVSVSSFYFDTSEKTSSQYMCCGRLAVVACVTRCRQVSHSPTLFSALRCKKFDVPLEKIYNKTQRDKFAWAVDMADEDFSF